MSCYECGRRPGDIYCRYTRGCPRGEHEGPQDWACIPSPQHLEERDEGDADEHGSDGKANKDRP